MDFKDFFPKIYYFVFNEYLSKDRDSWKRTGIISLSNLTALDSY